MVRSGHANLSLRVYLLYPDSPTFLILKCLTSSIHRVGPGAFYGENYVDITQVTDLIKEVHGLRQSGDVEREELMIQSTTLRESTACTFL